MPATERIPIFPLHTVLVPGGRLPLRIFEARYLDMVRDCAREDSGFGVCLLLPDTGETGTQHHARVGTLARIHDFYTLEDGLLGVTAMGEARFQVRKTRVRDNGLMMAEVRWLEEPAVQQVDDQFALLVDITGRLMEEVGKLYPDFEPDRLVDAGWIGYRLTELLPLDNLEKQVLLEFTDPRERLQRLLEVIPLIQENSEPE